MARILIGWELGAYTGHARRMIRVADALREAGHEIVMAVQRLDALAALGRADFAPWQAPLWPRLLGSAARPSARPPASHADILERLGLDLPGALGGLVTGWDRLIAAVDPALVIAEYAPALLAACAGRLPTMAVGNGFDMPSARMARFPSLNGHPPAADEAVLLARVNEELEGAGRPPLATLPALFAADRELACCFAEFDPFAEWRTEPHAAPEVALPIPLVGARRGSDLFVYWPGRFAIADKLWHALRLSGLPVLIHAPFASAEERAALAGGAVTFAPKPVPFADIVARSALVISHGGAGVVASALVAGLPQVVVPIDLEKAVQANGVVTLGVGGYAPPALIEPERFAADLRRLAADRSVAARARAVAAEKRPLLEPGLGATAQAIVTALLSDAG